MSEEDVPPGVLSGARIRHQAHVTLPPRPRNVAAARQFVTEHASDVTDEELRADLALLTSELVTNAVIHARTAIELGMTVTNRSLIVTVHDEDLGRAPNRAGGREGGWGLGLVRDLAEDFEMEHHAGEGKTAWFRLSREAKAS
jgi:anti-sigma regulatory factor (Ser/Thr protein kinase)